MNYFVKLSLKLQKIISTITGVNKKGYNSLAMRYYQKYKKRILKRERGNGGDSKGVQYNKMGTDKDHIHTLNRGGFGF